MLKLTINSILKYFIILFLITARTHAQTFSMGQFSIGQSNIDLDFKDFEIIKSHQDINAFFLKDSIQWIRPETNLLTPRALLQINISTKLHPVYIKYQNQIVFPSQQQDLLTTQVYVNLFHPEKIEIYQNNNIIDTIKLNAKSINNSKVKQWIDKTCTPYKVKLTGLDNEYSSIGCKLHRVGPIGSERPRLEITFTSPNLITPSGANPPFSFNLNNNSVFKTVLIDKESFQQKNLTISSQLPERLYRLKTAFGFGPYIFSNSFKEQKRGPDTALSYMLYGKYDLTETSSIKAFDALISHHAFFNNSGLYYSNDLAHVFDGDLIFGALIGFQGLHYRYDDGFDTEFEVIFPQGFELTYNNPFGFKNKYVSYGMFLSTTQETYRNIWLRFGDQIFYEVNYIAWGKEKSAIDMWGLSVGLPLFKAF